MLLREFIGDSLYDPHYWYFPQQDTVSTSAESFKNRNQALIIVSVKVNHSKYYTPVNDTLILNLQRRLSHSPPLPVHPQIMFLALDILQPHLRAEPLDAPSTSPRAC
ncbi:hypothetical protein BC827DRAFT_1273559 [Russula dissimulans]|nr:hypothetical protein BC827DRAFT_1273559 [Russula dissimulans]